MPVLRVFKSLISEEFIHNLFPPLVEVKVQCVKILSGPQLLPRTHVSARIVRARVPFPESRLDQGFLRLHCLASPS